MPLTPWLSEQTALPDGEVIASLYIAGPGWQIYHTASGGYALAAEKNLYQTWLNRMLLEDGFFAPFGENLFTVSVPAGDLISSVEYGPFTQSSLQALSFAKALQAAQRKTGALPADGIYISRFSLILPCRTGKNREINSLLGHWLCHGMNVCLSDTSRIRKYASWLDDATRQDMLQRFSIEEDREEDHAPMLTMPDPPADFIHMADGSYDSGGPLSSGSPDGTTSASASYLRKPRREGSFCLPGRTKLEQFFREEILDVIDREEEYRHFGVGFPGATLLYGPSGSGKTFAVERLAEYLGWPVYRITSGTVGSKYIHETSRRISQMFDIAIQNAPSILMIDEMEAFLSDRGSSRSSGEIHMEEVAEFLRRIPDAAQNRVLLFGMTNMPDAIDKAILRKGRFDHILEVGMPSKEEVQEVLESSFRDLPVAEGLNLSGIAQRLAGLPLSDVTFVIREAGRISVKSKKHSIDQESLEEALSQLAPAKKKRQIGFSV